MALGLGRVEGPLGVDLPRPADRLVLGLRLEPAEKDGADRASAQNRANAQWRGGRKGGRRLPEACTCFLWRSPHPLIVDPDLHSQSGNTNTKTVLAAILERTWYATITARYLTDD